ncbi:MAG: molybdopterin-guanine dinucleotide biosynthesis protein MobB [Clostridiales bacterium]|nr:molybdopterin-guanine dinucleotide biosynthesis protein MobB [Clostridiales bacterium]
MKVFSLCGYSDSGKTTTIELVIGELIRRGYKVGSVKEIHNEDFAIDREQGSNTRRHRAAGAEPVTARGLKETDVLYPVKLDMRKILSFYDDCDYVVCEGVRDYAIPMIMTGSKVEDLEEKWSELVFCVSGRVADEIKAYKDRPAISAVADIVAFTDLVEEKVFDLLPNAEPGHCGSCGGDCWTMAAKILRGEAKRSDCAGNRGTELVINGKRIDMQPFMEKILHNTVLGLLSGFKGFVDDAEISIRIK